MEPWDLFEMEGKEAKRFIDANLYVPIVLVLTSGLFFALGCLNSVADQALASLITALSPIFILVVPGYSLTLALFLGRELDFIERIVFSFALSVSSIPITLLYLNSVFKMEIDLLTSSFAVFLVTSTGTLIYFYRTGRITPLGRL